MRQGGWLGERERGWGEEGEEREIIIYLRDVKINVNATTSLCCIRLSQQ